MFNREKCSQRNRIAAKRDEVEAVHMSVLTDAPVIDEENLRAGRLPESMGQALEIINQKLPPSGKPLSMQDVYIRYAEAANTNYIRDRFMFLGESTLRNIVLNAEHGFAFMNSHRTGGLSSDAELPFGRTFSGALEQTRDGLRSLIGMYMLRGIHPNGANGPSTDELVRMIDGGTVFDLSVGLAGGERVCDVCGNDFRARDSEGNYLCPHIPGTTRKMDQGQIEAQQARGIKKGVASYTLNDAYCGETSAVYDGAVPGAGFRKLLNMVRSRTLTERELEEARSSYSTLLTRGDLEMSGDEIVEAINTGFSELGRRLGREERELPPALVAGELKVDPLLETLKSAGITTPEQLQALQKQAKDGERYRDTILDQCKKEAIRAFGQDEGEKLATSFSSMSIESLELCIDNYGKIADEKFRLKGNKGASRQTAARDLRVQQTPIFAVDAESQEDPDDNPGVRMAARAKAIILARGSKPGQNGNQPQESLVKGGI